MKPFQLIGVCILTFSLFAQDQIGFKTDRYSGINTASTLPTVFLDNTNAYDVNFFSFATLLQTNYGYISNASILKIITNIDGIEFVNTSTGITGDSQDLVVDFSNASANKFVFSNTEVMGPSFAFKFKDNKYSVGLFTKSRTAISGVNIDEGYNYHNFGKDNFNQAFTLDQAKLSGMTWAEFGANFAMVIKDNSWKRINGGINFKYLYGIEGAYINNKSNFDIINNENDTNLNGFVDLEVAYTEGINAENDYEFQQNGRGFGLDLGIAFINKLESDFDDPNDFEYFNKWEFNLLDVGYIEYKNSYLHNYQQEFNSLNSLITLPDTVNYLQELAQDLSNQVYGDPLQSQVDDIFTIGLPTALNIRHDRRLQKNLYINAQWTQRLPIFKNAIRRPNLLAVTPRYENRWLGLSAPISLFDYLRFQLGGHLRLGPLFMGTDNLFPFLIENNQLNSVDIYLGFKIYPLWKRKKKKRSKRKSCNCKF